MATMVDYSAVLDHSRHFSGVNRQGHIPGYLGHTPQLKYNFGKTYGQQTHDLRTPRYDIAEMPWTNYGLVTSRRATGDTSRYTRDMIPGYTGYIPRWPFKFGSSFKRECDECLDEFGTMQYQKEQDTARMMRLKQHPSTDESQVVEHLNYLHRTNNSKKADTDPPIPGYQGFIPRVHVSDVGLGQRFHEMAKSGYEDLYSARQ